MKEFAEYLSFHPSAPYIAALIYVAEIATAVSVIFLERKRPSATIAWVAVIFSLPIVGIILYFLISQNIARKKIYRLTEGEQKMMESSLHRQIEDIRQGRYRFRNPVEVKWSSLIQMNQQDDMAFLTQNNVVRLITDGVEMFDALLDQINSAQEYIHIEFFIIKNDNTGVRLMAALTKAAKRGVKVRLLVDAMGTRVTANSIVKEFAEAGGEVALFFPAFIKKVNLRFNYRNHRKLVVFDDRVAFVGGFNIGDEYLGKKKKFGFWRDTQLIIAGECVRDVNARFILDWRFASKENLSLNEAYYNFESRGGDSPIQVVSSGPDSDRQNIKHAYLKMISSASEKIYIQTPYFVPDGAIFDALVNAAYSGVDVRIMIPSIKDHVFVHWATLSYCGQLLSAGVKVYIYEGGFMHAKTIAVDGEVCSVGSANFDIRSFKLNFETNAIVYDSSVTAEMNALFEKDIRHSKELTEEEYEKRTPGVKFKESLSRLVSDIL
ncbi:MAG: cardiolipin synthase [Clostridiales Family XIII bacterium]|nr:cardiolipin synthase [Clostridiales Family XIII bacterium]